MTTTKADISLSGGWTNIVALDATLGSVEVLIQNKGPSRVHVVFGGAEPSGNTGPFLEVGVATTGTAAAIWCKAPAGSAVIGAELR